MRASSFPFLSSSLFPSARHRSSIVREFLSANGYLTRQSRCVACTRRRRITIIIALSLARAISPFFFGEATDLSGFAASPVRIFNASAPLFRRKNQ